MDVSVRVEGADAALRTLRTMEPIFAKEIAKDITKAGKLVAEHAKAKAPTGPTMSGWREGGATRGRTRGGAGWPAWQSPGVKVSRRGASVVIASTGAVAAIYESAGKNGLGGLSPTGGQFINNNSRHGRLVQSGARTGRLMIPSIAATYPQVISELRKACDRAVNEVNRRLNPWQ
jgi:hypothetical protein